MWFVPTTQSERAPATTYPRVAGVSTLAAMNKSLAQTNNSADGGEATKGCDVGDVCLLSLLPHVEEALARSGGWGLFLCPLRRWRTKKAHHHGSDEQMFGAK